MHINKAIQKCIIGGGVCLVVELAEGSHSSVDPVCLGFVGWDLHGQHVVGGMPCGGERASSSTGLVDWSGICWPLLKLALLPWLQPDDGNAVIEMFGVRLSNDHLLPVPACPLKEQSL